MVGGLEVKGGAQDGGVLDGRGHQAHVSGAGPQGAEEGEVVGLCSTAREDHAVFGDLECGSYPLTGLVHRSAAPAASPVNARGIAKPSVHGAQERLPGLRAQGRGGVVVQMNALHGSSAVAAALDQPLVQALVLPHDPAAVKQAHGALTGRGAHGSRAFTVLPDRDQVVREPLEVLYRGEQA